VVGSAEMKYQSCRGILHRLKAADKVDAITAVNPLTPTVSIWVQL